MQEEIGQFTKRCYEKPSLVVVRLFADNVLAVGDSPCYQDNQCSQPVMAPPGSA